MPFREWSRSSRRPVLSIKTVLETVSYSKYKKVEKNQFSKFSIIVSSTFCAMRKMYGLRQLNKARINLGK